MAENKEGSRIYGALAAFQAELPKVTLDGKNPHFGSKFASLANMSHIVLPLLAKHGLAFTAAPKVTEHGFVLEAALLHEAGEVLNASFPLNGGKPQDVGAALTYYRRYALASLTGVVADDDDDGNAASKVEPKKQAKPPAEWRAKIAAAADMAELTGIHELASVNGWLTPEVLEALTARKQQL